jgi:hypothetical protein
MTAKGQIEIVVDHPHGSRSRKRASLEAPPNRGRHLDIAELWDPDFGFGIFENRSDPGGHRGL